MTDQSAHPWNRVFNFTVTSLLILLIICVAVSYIYSAFSAFTHFKFTAIDYGRYVNMIWNCGHGHPFKMFTEFNYLQTHLSFTLALLGPVFLLWNHPFALWVTQLLLTLAGLLIMGRSAQRHNVPGVVIAAFLLFCIVSPFTQSVLLSEFHGVSLYFVLLPWLYYCLAFRKQWIWLPLLLTWGIREESAFIVLPLLIFFSIKDRWRTGFIWTVLSAAYGIFACTWLFRLINGISLGVRRPGVGNPFSLIESVWETIAVRAKTIALFMLPSLPFIRRGWLPILIFPSVPLIFTFFSPYQAQYTLRYHYSAPLQACLALGILQALHLCWQGTPRSPGLTKWFQVTALTGIALATHLSHGFLPFGQNDSKDYSATSPSGLSTLCAVAHLPPQGLLLCDSMTAGMCANREDIMTWDQYTPEKKQPDSIFADLDVITHTHKHSHEQELEMLLNSAAYGVSFFDGEHFILSRGYSRAKNNTVLTEIKNGARTIHFAYTQRTGGEDFVMPDCSVVSYWAGGAEGNNLLVAYGLPVKLPAGTYRALFRLRVADRQQSAPGQKGILRLNKQISQVTIAQAAITSPAEQGNEFHEQSLVFHLAEQTLVEPQVIGGTAQLWLDRVVFMPADE